MIRLDICTPSGRLCTRVGHGSCRRNLSSPRHSQFVCHAGRESRLGLGPRKGISRDEALELQLHSLQVNNTPYTDHGVEVMYRFAKFDPFARSRYFGKSLDLGQFERFRRVWFTPWFTPLVGHTSATVTSQLPVSEDLWKVRLLVKYGLKADQHAMYEVTMMKDTEGIHKDIWMTSSLIRDDTEGIPSYL